MPAASPIDPSEHIGLARALALAAARGGSRLDADDLVCAGVVGIVAAAKTFDPRRGVQFGAYARLIVLGAIKAFVSTEYRNRGLALRGPTGRQKWKRVASVKREADMRSEEPFPPDGACLDPEPDDTPPSSVFARAREVLTDRERAVVEGFYLHGKCGPVIAAELGLPVSTVYSVRSRAIRVLRARLRFGI